MSSQISEMKRKEDNAVPSIAVPKSIFDFVSKITPTDDQSTALKKLQDFVEQAEKQIFILNGYAGTGKTTISESLCAYLEYKNKPFKVMAPTGRASKNFNIKTGFGSQTVHSSIYLTVMDEENLEPSFILKDTWENGTIAILDESSMLTIDTSEFQTYKTNTTYLYGGKRGSNILNDLFEIMNLGINKKSKIIFVGDEAQLLLKDKPYALDQNFFERHHFLCEKCTLTEVKRNDNDILTLATRYRELIMQKQWNTKIFPSDKMDIQIIPTGGLISRFMANNPKVEHTANSVVICKSNLESYGVNQELHSQYFGNEGVSIGDKIMSYANNYSKVNAHMNGDIFTVLKVLRRNLAKTISINKLSEAEKAYVRKAISDKQLPSYIEVTSGDSLRVTLSYTLLLVLNDEGNVFRTYICNHYMQSSDANRNLLIMRANIIYAHMRYKRKENRTITFEDWSKRDLRSQTMQAKYGYAMTGHKAQGGEWENIYTSIAGKANEYYLRFMYTACTRAVNKLYLEK